MHWAVNPAKKVRALKYHYILNYLKTKDNEEELHVHIIRTETNIQRWTTTATKK